MQKVIFLVCVMALTLALLAQEIQHETTAININ